MMKMWFEYFLFMIFVIFFLGYSNKVKYIECDFCEEVDFDSFVYFFDVFCCVLG